MKVFPRKSADSKANEQKKRLGQSDLIMLLIMKNNKNIKCVKMLKLFIKALQNQSVKRDLSSSKKQNMRREKTEFWSVSGPFKRSLEQKLLKQRNLN